MTGPRLRRWLERVDAIDAAVSDEEPTFTVTVHASDGAPATIPPPVMLYWTDTEGLPRHVPDAMEKLLTDGGYVVVNDQVVGRIAPGSHVEVVPPVEPELPLREQLATAIHGIVSAGAYPNEIREALDRLEEIVRDYAEDC